MNILSEFLLNFEDCALLWKDRNIFKEAADLDKNMRKSITRFVKNGRFK